MQLCFIKTVVLCCFSLRCFITHFPSWCRLTVFEGCITPGGWESAIPRARRQTTRWNVSVMNDNAIWTLMTAPLPITIHQCYNPTLDCDCCSVNTVWHHTQPGHVGHLYHQARTSPWTKCTTFNQVRFGESLICSIMANSLNKQWQQLLVQRYNSGGKCLLLKCRQNGVMTWS